MKVDQHTTTKSSASVPTPKLYDKFKTLRYLSIHFNIGMIKTFTLCLICFSALFIACHADVPSENQEKNEVAGIVPELDQLNVLIVSNPEEFDLRLQRAKLYYQMEQYPQAIGDLELALQLDSTDLQTRHLLADAYLDNYQSRKALGSLEKTVMMYPESIPSLLKLAEFQLILKRHQEAMHTLAIIHDLDHQNADAYFMKGMVLKETGDTTLAIRHFQNATRENPNLIDAWINLGQLHEALNDAEAIRYYDAGLAVSPDNPLLLLTKAQYLAGQDRIDESKSIYHFMMELDPYSFEPYYDLGLLYLDQDSLNQAVNHFDLSIKINPMYARAYFYRGYTRELTGQVDEARYDYEQTLRLNPGDSDAKEALDRLIEKKIIDQ